MGNIFAPATPQPEPLYTAWPPRPERHVPERHIPERHVPERHVPERQDIPLRNRQGANAPTPNSLRCPYYARGTCLRGDNCRFLHEGTNRTLREPRADPQPRRPCLFFARGRCNKGAACRFSHDKSGAGAAAAGEGGNGKAPHGGPATDDRSNDGSTYELGGAWVKFDNGATVSKVAFSSDYSAVSIRNLPQGSSVNTVRAMLEDVGIPTSAAEIRVTAQPEQQQCTAIIKAEDPSFAKKACAKLDTYTTLPDIKAVAVPPLLPHSRSPYQIDCRKVHCAWNRPVREAKLKFGARNTAARVQKQFRAGSYKVLGSKVMAVFQGSQRGQDGWVVKLTGLGGATEEQDIIRAIPEPDRPQNVELGEPSYVADMEFDSTIIKSMLLEFGPLERWDVSSSSKAKRFNAHGTFLEESSARDAASSLNNKPLSFSETTQLSVWLVASAKFKIPAKIYDVVRPRIEAQKAVWERQFIRCFEIPAKGLYRILRLEGDNHQQVVQAKESIERIIGGEVVRMDGKDLRCGNFRKDGEEHNKVKLIEDAFKVAIVPDIRRSQFRVFGLEECPGHVLERITTMLQGCICESHVIELNDADFMWALTGGLGVLKSQLGEGKVAQKYRRIFIRGSKEDYNNAMAILTSKQIASFDAASRSEMECTTCLCEAEDPIRMSCDHVYCSACFVQMCESEMTATREFRICCVKATDSNGKVCQKAFSLSEIQEHLPSETFEDVLSKSFESYVTRHPADFTYCPSPDCGQIYRVASRDAENPITFTCNKCLTSTCTSCHSSHPGKRCTRSGGNASGGPNALSDKTKEELGIKVCPRCARLMEKTGGCNHMTCPCGAHVCWVCLVSFEMGEQCYEHMRRVHGGIGV